MVCIVITQMGPPSSSANNVTCLEKLSLRQTGGCLPLLYVLMQFISHTSKQTRVGHDTRRDDVRGHILADRDVLSPRLQMAARDRYAATSVPTPIARRAHSREQHNRLPPACVVVVFPQAVRPVRVRRVRSCPFAFDARGWALYRMLGALIFARLGRGCRHSFFFL